MRLVCLLSASAFLFACSSEPDGILVELSPELISSIDGTLHVSGLVIDERTPVGGESVTIAVTYTDRNGESHDIAGAEVTSDARGAFEAVLEGFAWEGSGTVTATLTGGDVSAEATFAVLDRTPPVVEIVPPTTDLHVGQGLPIDVEVHVTDEIGASQVTIEAAGELERVRTSVVASGSTDATVTFRFDIPDGAIPGPTITLYALGTDLSGNQAAAEPITLIVDPAIAIATPSPLTGTLLTDGTGTFLENPHALARSPKDGQLYVADGSGGTCNNRCIRKVDPATGALDTAWIFVAGQGQITGLAFDATGDNLYFSNPQDFIGRLTYDTGNSRYATTSTSCASDVTNNRAQDPVHMVVDPTLGVLVADTNDSVLKAVDVACNTGTALDDASNGNLDNPWGVALGAAGEIFVSDEGRDEIRAVDRTSGDETVFEDANLDQPRGIEWMAGGTSQFADTLLVANNNDRTVISTSGPNTTRAAVYLRAQPVDVAIDGTTAYVLVEPVNNDPGRIFTVTGF